MLDHAQVRKEVKIINHSGDVAPDLGRGLRHGVAAHLDAAIVCPVCTDQAAQQGGLASPLRPVSAIASPVRTSRLNFSKMVFGRRPGAGR